MGLDRLTQKLASLLAGEPYEVLFLIDGWFQQEMPYSQFFEDAYDEAYAGLLPHLPAEFERVAAARGDDLSVLQAKWQASTA